MQNYDLYPAKQERKKKSNKEIQPERQKVGMGEEETNRKDDK